MMRHPFIVEDELRRSLAERLAKVEQEELVKGAARRGQAKPLRLRQRVAGMMAAILSLF